MWYCNDFYQDWFSIKLLIILTFSGELTLKITIRPFEKEDEKSVIDIWFACNLVIPLNNPKSDIERKLKVNPELFLIAVNQSEVIGTCMAGFEGHRGWINYLAVLPEFRRKGIAGKLMEYAEKRLSNIGCSKINLQIREGNLEVIKFYESIGYAVDPVLSMGKRLSFDPKYDVQEL